MGSWSAAGMSAALIAAVEPLSEVLARTTAEAEAATRKSSGYLRQVYDISSWVAS